MFFDKYGIKELNEKYILSADIETLRNLCSTDKYVNEICNDDYFWIRKFQNDGLPVPKIKFTTSKQYISTYIYTAKIMDYIFHVLKTKYIRISFDNLDLFHNYVNHKDLEKCYMAWQKLQKFYIFNIRNSRENNILQGNLYIDNIKNDEYKIRFRINDEIISINNVLSTNDIINILYELISKYHVPYDNIPIEIISYDFEL